MTREEKRKAAELRRRERLQREKGVVEQYRQGVPVREITGADMVNLYRILRRHGVPVARKVRPDLSVARMVPMYKSGMGIEEIATDLQCSSSTVWKRLKGHVTFRSSHKSGPEHWNWKGGCNTGWDDLRASPAYQAWKAAVHARDGDVCQLCSEQTLAPHAHHIIMKVVSPELVFEVSNGITLCPRCHNSIVNTREGIFEPFFQDAVSTGGPLPTSIFRWFAEVLLDIQPAPCACGCGDLTRIFHGKPNKYIVGHHARGRRMSEGQRAAMQRHWFKSFPQDLVDKVLARRGTPQRKIAKELNVSQGWVSKILLQNPA